MIGQLTILPRKILPKKNERIIGVSAEGDPAYPPKTSLPPIPFGQLEIVAQGFNKLGWHWCHR